MSNKSEKSSARNSAIAVALLALFGSAFFEPVSAAEVSPELKARMKQPKEIASADDLGRWMTYYYLHPQPDLLVPAVLYADRNNLLTGDYVAPFQAFLSRVFAQNPDKIGGWFNALAPMKENNRTLLLTSIWWSNTAQGKQILQQLCKSLPEKPQAEFKKQIDSDPPLINEMPMDNTALLDMLWAAYCASGDDKYVKRLLTSLPWADGDQKNLNKLMLASAAKWSLTSNCEQHPKVMEICEQVASSDPALKKYIDPVLADARKRSTASRGSAAQ